MKKLVYICLGLVLVYGAMAQEKKLQASPKIEFKEKLFDFGVIVQGDTVNHTFTFENVGMADLKILSARGSCGCTVPSYPKEAIAPGAKGEIKVRFVSAGKRGNQNKTVTLVTNDPSAQQIVLTLRGTIQLAIPEQKK